MTERIEEYERVRPDQILWICTECEGVLEPLGNLDRDDERNKEDWWKEAERWADEPAVVCSKCDQRYRVRFEPVDV
jgi:hypothetical protein